MHPTFGDQLKLFALSLDGINEPRLNTVNRMIDNYCHETLDIESINLYISYTVDKETALKRYKLGESKNDSCETIKDGDRYRSQTALSYEKGKPLWVTSQNDKQELECTEQYCDQWSGLEKELAIPAYRSPESGHSNGCRTSIMIPLASTEAPLGVLSFETSEYIEITEEAKDELSSKPLPFDFAQERMINIERKSSGALKSLKKFKADLRNRLTALLE